MIRVELPAHLRTLARVGPEVRVDVAGVGTVGGVIEALERQYPVLAGALREHGAAKRRPLVRFFACREDLSNAPFDFPLPAAVVAGKEPFLIVGAIAGG